MITFDDVFSYENLFNAYKSARRCKRHKREVVEFELNLASNLTKLERDLKDGTYKIQKYKKFMIYDPKEREIQALSFYDRVVQNCLCNNFMVPVFTKQFIFDNCACQKGKGTHFARARVAKFIREYYNKYGQHGYVLQMDIKKYFNNINHTVLKGMIGKKIFDEKIKKLVFDIIDSYEYSQDCGVPMGNQTSQVFALFYLSELDRIIKSKFKIKYYVRYMDDLVLICNNKQLLQQVFSFASEYVKGIKLELNSKSTIYQLKNGLGFLGVDFRLCKSGKLLLKLRRASKKRMVSKIKWIVCEDKNGHVNYAQTKMSLAGFNGNVLKLNGGKRVIKFLESLA